MEIDHTIERLKGDMLCCGEQLYFTKSHLNGVETAILVCLNCGYSLAFREEQLDDEEVEDYADQAANVERTKRECEIDKNSKNS